MDSKDDVRSNAVRAATDAVANLIYTVAHDLSNNAITAGIVKQEEMIECANTTLTQYGEVGIKIRKRPVPRPKAPTTTKARPDALTAASKKMNSIANNCTWIHHPNDKSYSYTYSVKLANGYPVRNNATEKIEYVATSDETTDLTVDDAKIALSYGFDVNYDKIKKT